MPKFLALVAYRCTIAGSPDQSLDLQAQYFECESEDEVRLQIEAATPNEYTNEYGQLVSWPLAAVLAIDACSQASSGAEVAGVITSADELARLAEDDSAA